MGKIGHHAKAIVFAKNGQFGSKIKILKNMRKTTLQTHYSCSAQKTAPKTTNIKKNGRFLKMGKIGHHAKAIVFAKNGQFGSKIKILKNMRKTTLQTHYSCSAQKTAPKNTQYSTNANFLKMGKSGHHAKAIVFAKKGQFGSKIKILKNMRKTTVQTH